MLTLVFRALLTTVVLVAASLVFADALVVSALILVTIGLTAASLVLDAAGADEHEVAGSPREAEEG